MVRYFKSNSVFLLFIIPAILTSHGVPIGDQGYIQEISGVKFAPFMYLGAKHMVTGYDHLLFLVGVIFFLYKLKDIAIYVSLFAVGHSSTLLFGVFTGIHINAYIIDAIIGLSVVYKALDNLGFLKKWLGFQPNTKVSTFIFGLFHGFGLAAKIIEFDLDPVGLLSNLISFNIGVEIGQLLALSTILIMISFWRKRPSFLSYSVTTNIILMVLGFILAAQQILGYINSI
ncbi:MAG: hypothetical protein CMG04_06085 [Candidatus Marinimicrobia bacterium]|nr:hypothetical protein [Candidatus Neomarinimicrobiota bacterium]|tara:strand:+ start:490 stop:1176 length:687 start_codon:yes stop_codon:yes gene_type:complete